MPLILRSLQSVSTPLSCISSVVTPPIRAEPRFLEDMVVSKRRTLCFGACVLSSVFGLSIVGRSREALALDLDEFEQEEDRVVNIFQVFMTICVCL